MRHVAVVAFDGVEALDLFGPCETFAKAKVARWNQPCYSVRIVGFEGMGARVVSESGLSIGLQAHIDEAVGADTLIVPGGAGLRNPETLAAVATWLHRHAHSFRRVASVCTGLYALAHAGLVDGRRVTTHWAYASDIARRFPALNVAADELFVRDGRFYTAGGISAGINLALAMIEEDFGAPVALAAAREIVAYFARPGDQAQFCSPLVALPIAIGRFAELAHWIAQHLRDNLSVEELAARVGLSCRHFRRRFVKEFGSTPAGYVELLRLDEARRLLTGSSTTVGRISAAAGFPNDDSFRRAFRRRYHVSPNAFRAAFRRTGSGLTGDAGYGTHAAAHLSDRLD